MDLNSVDVVILTWNDEPSMLDTAIRSALGSVGVEVSVHVVDNGSEPAPLLAEDLQTDARVRLIRSERNLGVARGRNLGIASGHNPYVLLLDSDAELRPDCARRLLDAVRTPVPGDVSFSAPVYAGQRPEESAGMAPTLRLKMARALNRRGDYQPVAVDGEPTWEIDFAIGACQLFERSAWESIGGIDETYFYGPEDVDFCLRLKKSGRRLVQVAGAECVHPPRRRHKNLLTVRGAQHGVAVVRHLWRHRGGV